jgi:hypothetical protein
MKIGKSIDKQKWVIKAYYNKAALYYKLEECIPLISTLVVYAGFARRI